MDTLWVGDLNCVQNRSAGRVHLLPEVEFFRKPTLLLGEPAEQSENPTPLPSSDMAWDELAGCWIVTRARIPIRLRVAQKEKTIRRQSEILPGIGTNFGADSNQRLFASLGRDTLAHVPGQDLFNL